MIEIEGMKFLSSSKNDFVSSMLRINLRINNNNENNVNKYNMNIVIYITFF